MRQSFCCNRVQKTLLGLFFAARILSAQVERANLTGTIADPSGAPVPAAGVEVLFEQIGFRRAVQTSGAGTYVLAALPLGRCRITVKANGFQTQEVRDLTLAVGETRTLDFR